MIAILILAGLVGVWAYPFGPVFNKTTDLWDWQRANLFDVAKGYRLMKEAV